MTVKSQTIKAIFTNLLFLIGVILIVIGFIRGVSTSVKLVVFDKYPLQSYEESRCEFNNYAKPRPVMEGGTEAVLEDTRTDQEKQECKDALELDRKLRMVEDITTTIGFLISGMVISAIFRRFIFQKEK